MRNEMGNQNTSGIKEEDKAATEVPEEAHEAGNVDKAMKGENNIIPEDQTEDFHEKTEDLPSHYLSAATDTSAKRRESDKKEQGGKESETDKLPEASVESINSVGQLDYIKKADLCCESNMENILPINDKLQIHDQYPVGRETLEQTIERQAESNSSNSVAKSVQDSNPADDSTSPLEECPNLSLQDSEEAKELSESYHMQKEKKNGDYVDTKDNIVDLVLEESIILGGKPSGQNVGIEICDKNGTEEIFENGHENNGNVEVPLKVNSSDVPSLPIETVPEVSSQSPSAACPEPQEKHIVHAEEMKVTPVKSEKGENKPDSDQPQSSELTVSQLDVGTASIKFHEDFCKENGDENTLSLSSGSDLEKVLSTEGHKVIQNGSKGISADKKKFVASGQEQYRNPEEIIVMPEIVSLSNEFTTIDKYDEVTEKYFVQETENRTQEPWSTRKSTHARGTSQSFHSFGGENELVAGYHTSQINSHHGLHAAYPTSSFNSLSGNGTLMGSGAAEDENKFTVSSKENISYVVLINEISTCNAENAYVQSPKNCNNVQGLSQKVQMKSGTVAPTEMSLSQSNKQIMTDETCTLPSSKAQESSARLSIDSNPDHSSQRVQLRKSPSFEFGLPLDARSEESDQTPLLVRDKSLVRSFSGSASVKFQNTMLSSDYGRKSLDYEPIQVEEKTIRMERSTSDISRDSFMNFLKKDAKANIEHTSLEKQDSHAADEKASDSPSQELALTSVKANGKRKPRSSLFSACICCSAAIH